jgi:hypothetical protein
VRRSQILRDLKRLAVMKCQVAALRSTVSHRTEINAKKASDHAADLLLQLDFIRVSLKKGFHTFSSKRLCILIIVLIFIRACFGGFGL